MWDYIFFKGSWLSRLKADNILGEEIHLENNTFCRRRLKRLFMPYAYNEKLGTIYRTRRPFSISVLLRFHM